MRITVGGLPLIAPVQGGAREEVQVEGAVIARSLIRIAAYRNGKGWNVKETYVAYEHARTAFYKIARQTARLIIDPAVAMPKPSPTDRRQ